MNYLRNMFCGENCRECQNKLLKVNFFSEDDKSYVTKYICPNCTQQKSIEDFVKWKNPGFS
jgi:hypothetical protein